MVGLGGGGVGHRGSYYKEMLTLVYTWKNETLEGFYNSQHALFKMKQVFYGTFKNLQKGLERDRKQLKGLGNCIYPHQDTILI